MINRLIHIIVFGCLGTTAEVWFTAIGAAVDQFRDSDPVGLSLRGHSYIWMFFIYASAAVLFPIFYHRVARLALPIRLVVYMTSIFVIEYLSGWLLELTTGSCPWHYQTGWAVHGFIRLDYAPFWLAFGLVLEFVYRKLEQLAPINAATE